MGIQNYSQNCDWAHSIFTGIRIRGNDPVEIEVPSHRRVHFNEAENEKLQLEALDFLDEKRKEARLRVSAYQQRIARHFNSKVRQRSFEVGDLVLKRVMTATGVFGPNWEGPYVIGNKLLDGS